MQITAYAPCAQGPNTAPSLSPNPNAMQNIIATAKAAGSFSTLLAAVDAAGLTQTLAGPGPFTLFAPSDEAFAKLPAGTVEGLLADKAKLTAVLTYHVAHGEVRADDVRAMASIPTLQGGSLNVDLTDGVMIGSAKVMSADIACTNGIIHAIDSVLIPNA